MLFQIRADSTVVLLLIHLLQFFLHCLLPAAGSSRVNAYANKRRSTEQKPCHDHNNQNLRGQGHPGLRHPLRLLLPLPFLAFQLIDGILMHLYGPSKIIATAIWTTRLVIFIRRTAVITYDHRFSLRCLRRNPLPEAPCVILCLLYQFFPV